MDIKKLKRVYDASRALRKHTQGDAAMFVGKSQSMINQVLAGDVTSRPTVDAILDYCYKAGMSHTIKKLGLEPDQKMQPEAI